MSHCHKHPKGSMSLTSLIKPKPLSLWMKTSPALPYFSNNFLISSSVISGGRFPTNRRLLWVKVFSPGFRKFFRSIVRPSSEGNKVHSCSTVGGINSIRFHQSEHRDMGNTTHSLQSQTSPATKRSDFRIGL